MARYMTTAESASELTGTSVERSHEMLETVPLREMARLTAQELAQAAGLTGPQSYRLAAALTLGAKLNAEGGPDGGGPPPGGDLQPAGAGDSAQPPQRGPAPQQRGHGPDEGSQ